ncbi:hypothetical protein COCOBI_14-0280 [Coccomyxa sp. Obi]|nr:hypothetical protein COCOBI_14-0280 [Coccomyxa sp. Obi]
MRMGMGSIGQAVGLCVAIATGVATNFMNGCGRRSAEEQLRDLGEEPTVCMMEECLWNVNNFVYEEDRSKAIGEERDGFCTRNVPKGNVNGGKFSTENGVKRAVMVGMSVIMRYRKAYPEVSPAERQENCCLRSLPK